jgi:hypothetical protein
MDELHQVLVGRHDAHLCAGLDRLAGVGGDEVVGLIGVLLDAGDPEGGDGLADEAELGDEVGRRGRALGLVLGYMAVRKERSALSKTTARWVGASPALVSRRSLLSMAQKPCTAPTGRPSERRVRGGRA